MFDLASINAMQTHTSAKPTFRTYAVLVCIFRLGAALLIHGLESWNEGSVRLKGRVGETFIATRGGPNAGSFYFYVPVVLTGGAVSLLVGLVLAWRAFLSRDLVGKAQALTYLNTPIRENHRMPIPTWLCWALVLVVLGIFAYAFIRMR
ncbi:hypothetical protein [Ralstonia wenshanensis]|uniref:hypothetical protein n=1 Tax=Ralstonia wenshanensis TaxID=2842456 RepID=UPI002AAE476A|nr:hypothetical protein [Ralstonia wenshanensis]MDY7507955.1 hypothetical protein [Ralstonia wenshanensis]